MMVHHGNSREQDVRVTMIEIEAGEGYNEGPELRVLIQANRVTTLPKAIEAFSPAQTEIFSRYRRNSSDYRPLLGHHDGYRFNDEWTFPIKEAS